MKTDFFEPYIAELLRLAESKCHSQADAEELVSETIVAALVAQRRGEHIAYPRTWLTRVLMHKFHDHLRHMYRQPNIVCYDQLTEVPAEESDMDEEEFRRVRREVIYLAGLYRDVMIRYYYQGQSVAEIARALGIPEGTVKSRLSAGREKIRKGITDMNEKTVHMPGRLHLSFGGSEGRENRPMSLVEGDRIAQNLLYIVYKKPLSIREMAERIEIPTVYIEPIVQRLTEGELMAAASGDTYYTDFPIYSPEDQIRAMPPQKAFAKAHFSVFERVIRKMLSALSELPFYSSLTQPRQRKLERYALLSALQEFEYHAPDVPPLVHPARADGGHWLAQGMYFPMDYDTTKFREVQNHMILGGHRSSRCLNLPGASAVHLYEFDTPFWDSPHRFAPCGVEVYFTHMIPLLWGTWRGVNPDLTEIPTILVETIPRFVELGLFCYRDGGLEVDIPVLSREEYREIRRIVDTAFAALNAELGSSYREMVYRSAITFPPHLTNVPDLYRILPATRCTAMSVLRLACEREVHLHDVDYCCPPVVMVFDE